jgi:3-phosphoshikimate 1-carboxyvinyltransferase
MLAAISKGTTRIKNLLMADDIKRTIEAFQAMGVSIFFERGPKGRVEKFSTRFARSNNIIVVEGVGMRGLKKPSKPLYLGNSGTTMRILPGILAGQDFDVTLTGDKSLSGRPMHRIIEPLKKMGVRISGYPPLKIHGGKLKTIKYNSKIASAQVKSCILLAGLYADGITSVTEPVQSRDHTERMLKIFGCRVKSGRRAISLKGPVKLKSPGTIEIPGDISSAAFFIVAGCILPGIKITLKNIGLNPTRTGVIDILKRMGAEIEIVSCMSLRAKRSNLKKRDCFALSGLAMTNYTFEPYGDIIIKSSKLKGVTISPEEVVVAIDEIPIIMVAACFAKGRTVIKGIEELRVKETDRIKSMVTNLRKMGADIKQSRSQFTSHSHCLLVKKNQ